MEDIKKELDLIWKIAKWCGVSLYRGSHHIFYFYKVKTLNEYKKNDIRDLEWKEYSIWILMRKIVINHM